MGYKMISIVAIELIGIGALYALSSITLQRKLINVDKMYEIRAELNAKQKELLQMSKSNSDRESITAKYRELNKLMSESMKNQIKPTFVILPAFLLLYYVLLPTLIPTHPSYTIFPQPINLALITIPNVWGYRAVAVATAVIVGIVLSIAFSVYDRKRLREKYTFGLTGPLRKDAQAGTNV